MGFPLRGPGRGVHAQVLKPSKTGPQELQKGRLVAADHQRLPGGRRGNEEPSHSCTSQPPAVSGLFPQVGFEFRNSL